MSFFHIAYLMDTVDYFLLIESDTTHVSEKKTFYFIDYYADVLTRLNSSGKIIAEKITFPGEFGGNNWKREKYQRNFATNILLGRFQNESFVVIVGDADELPRKEVAQTFTARYDDLFIPARLVMHFLYYSFKWVKRDAWARSFVISSAGLRALNSDIDDVRVRDQKQHSRVLNGGWHCSYFMNSTEVVRKVQSFAHQEYNLPQYKDIEWVERCRREGIDLYNRTMKGEWMSAYPASNGYPECHNCSWLPEYHLFELPVSV